MCKVPVPDSSNSRGRANGSSQERGWVLGLGEWRSGDILLGLPIDSRLKGGFDQFLVKRKYCGLDTGACSISGLSVEDKFMAGAVSPPVHYVLDPRR